MKLNLFKTTKYNFTKLNRAGFFKLQARYFGNPMMGNSATEDLIAKNMFNPEFEDKILKAGQEFKAT